MGLAAAPYREHLQRLGTGQLAVEPPRLARAHILRHAVQDEGLAADAAHADAVVGFALGQGGLAAATPEGEAGGREGGETEEPASKPQGIPTR